MQFEYSPYLIPLGAAVIFSGWVAFYAWNKRSSNPSAIALALLSLSIAIWALGFAVELSGANLATKIWGGKIGYLGAAFAPLFWLVFAFNHANPNNQLNHKILNMMATLPAITVLLVFTTDLHGLVWDKMYVEQASGFAVLGVTHGLWFWVHFAYSYLLLLIGSGIVLRSVGRMQGLYQGQAVALIIAVVAPWLANILYFSGLNPIPHLDLTPFAFTITVAGLAWGIFGYRLIDLSPVAREIVVENMRDGMLVLDAQNNIVDANPAAARLFDAEPSKIIGQPVVDLLSPWPHLVAQFRDVAESREEISIGEGETQRWYELRLSPLKDRRNHFAGRVITIRSVTDRKQAEQQQRAFLDDMKALQEIYLILSEVSDLETLYVKMIELSQQRLGLDRVGLFVLDEAARTLLGTYGVDPDGQVRDERYYREVIEPGHWTIEVLEAPNHAKLWASAPIFDNGLEVGTGWKAATALWSGDKAVGYLVCDAFHSKRVARPYETELISVLGGLYGRLIESKIADQQIRLQAAALTSTANAIVITDTKGVIQWVNPAFTTLTGYSPEEALGQSPNLLKSGQHDRAFYQQLWDTLQAGEVWHGEVINRRKDGRFYTEEQTITPVQNERGEVFRYIAIKQDVTERKHAEELLLESEARFRQIVENASDIIFRTDAEGRFTYVNPTALYTAGFATDSEMLGRHFIDMAQPDWRSRLKRFYGLQFMRQEPSSYLEFPIISQAGREIWLGQNVQIIKEDDKVVGFQALARDITELRRTQEALALSRDQALEASRLKSQLLAKVSHELRTPLGGILGYAELLQLDTFGPLNEEQKQAAGQIVESADYLDKMINELLDQAQIEARTIILRQEAFSPATLLQKVLSKMTVLAQNKGLELTSTLAAEVPEKLMGDERRLQQVLINLTGNAIKYTRLGQVKISFSRPDPAHWELAVSDTGAGIPKEALAYIFEPFRQVDNSITRENRGTGLGLSITKQMVELMGGQITVISAVDLGSTFTVTLPIVD